MRRKVQLSEVEGHWFFTADLHLDHDKIRTMGRGRPFSSVDEMNEALVENWNAKVTERDAVIVAGDLSYKRPDYWLSRLNGRKILVLGNHDHLNAKAKEQCEAICDLLDISIRPDGPSITVCHYAMRVWSKSHYGSWMLHGHSHGALPGPEHHEAAMNWTALTGVRSLDIGVDVHD